MDKASAQPWIWLLGLAGCLASPAPSGTWIDPAAVAGDSATPPYDADNYACKGGLCQYTGCLSDAECQTLGPYACVQNAALNLALCQPTCQTAADCAPAGAVPAMAADNWLCQKGLCEYAGCKSPAECQAQGPGYTCAAPP